MSSPSEQSVAGLRRKIEDLAMQVVLEEPAPGSESLRALAQRLSEFSHDAGKAGHSEAARAAGELAGRILDTAASSEAGDAGLESVIESGIGQLQQLLEAAGPAPAATETPALAQDPELLGDFVVESREHLATIETQVLALERNPADPEPLNSIFRGFHTIKGLAGFLELQAIRDVSHEIETVLDVARNGRMAITPVVIDVILSAADYLSQGVGNVEAQLTGREPAPIPDRSRLLERIANLMLAPAAAAEQTEPATEQPAAKANPEPQTTPKPQPEETPEPAEPTGPQPGVARKTAAPAPGGRSPAAADSHVVRVETGKLDYLVDMVGEMVIAQSLVRHDPELATLNHSRLLRNIAQLSRITGEVQKTAMAMRMMPVRNLFQRMARLVRDLSRKAGKPAELMTAGDDTELDRTIVEEIADPLMHMIRNAVDHGIETPAARAAAGKDPTARIRLEARHEAGNILIQVSDDGRGIDRDRVFRKGVEKGLVSADTRLSDAEILNLIFEPGFSTAEQVTDVSGRGVGMDVVRKHIQKLRGRVHIESTPGQGTSFFIKLPLTLAIIDGLVVGVGRERYILPIFTVREMVRPVAGTVSTLHGRSEMALIRDTLLPVVRLHRRFGVQARSEDPCESLLIVAESSSQRFCIMVDELIGKQEVVIKSLGEALKNIPGVAGGAILGDGHVGLILDVDGVFAEQAHA